MPRVAPVSTTTVIASRRSSRPTLTALTGLGPWAAQLGEAADGEAPTLTPQQRPFQPGPRLQASTFRVGSDTGIASCLRKVIGGGEPGLAQPELRRRIAGGLALTHLRETMGLGDVMPSMWGECEAEDGMHFNAQRYVMVELIDPESGATLPWRDGGTGELVYTTFARDATPVVRYRSRDHAEVVAMRCACGFPGWIFMSSAAARRAWSTSAVCPAPVSPLSASRIETAPSPSHP